MNITIGTIQEIHGKKVLDGLKIVTLAKSRVLRNGEEKIINADDIVIDDIVFLKAGEQATADFELLDGYLQVDESNLTGESDYIKKYPGDKIYSGSSIIVGEGKLKTINVGDDTFAASISSKVKSITSFFLNFFIIASSILGNFNTLIPEAQLFQIASKSIFFSSTRSLS